MQSHNKKQKCRVCGCTNEFGCVGGCYWVEEDLCSSCFNDPGNARYQKALRNIKTYVGNVYWGRTEDYRGPEEFIAYIKTIVIEEGIDFDLIDPEVVYMKQITKKKTKPGKENIDSLNLHWVECEEKDLEAVEHYRTQIVEK